MRGSATVGLLVLIAVGLAVFAGLRLVGDGLSDKLRCQGEQLAGSGASGACGVAPDDRPAALPAAPPASPARAPASAARAPASGFRSQLVTWQLGHLNRLRMTGARSKQVFPRLSASQSPRRAQPSTLDLMRSI